MRAFSRFNFLFFLLFLKKKEKAFPRGCIVCSLLVSYARFCILSFLPLQSPISFFRFPVRSGRSVRSFFPFFSLLSLLSLLCFCLSLYLSRSLSLSSFLLVSVGCFWHRCTVLFISLVVFFFLVAVCACAYFHSKNMIANRVVFGVVLQLQIKLLKTLPNRGSIHKLSRESIYCCY